MIQPEPAKRDDPQERRRLAKEVAADRMRKQEFPPPEQVQDLIRELLVQQVDLEMQLESLQAALRTSGETYRRLVENLRDEYFFYRHGTDGVFTYLSPSVTTVLGYTVDEFKTHYSTFMTDNPINQDVERSTQLSIQGMQQPKYEVEIRHKDGSVRRLEVLEQPILDEQERVSCVEGIAHDITGRIIAEESLRREHERIELMLQASDRELKTISYEIHDGITQMLSAAAMHFDSYDDLKKGDPEAASRACDQGRQLVAKCLSEARRLIARVRLPLLDERGVVAAIQNLVDESNEQSKVKTEWHVL